MSDTPNYEEVMGFGQPILSARVGDSEVTLHRKESEGLMPSPSPLGSLHFRVVSPDEPLGGGGMVGHPWGGTVVGDQRIICGQMPTGAQTAEVTVARGAPAHVHSASGAWLVVAPRDRKLKIIFRDAGGKSVEKMTIRPWSAEPSREELMAAARSDWVEDPEYVPIPDEGGADEEGHSWGELIGRYGLGEPVLTVPVGDQTASLYRQRHTGRIWCAITGIGGSFGPIDDKYFGWEANHFEEWQVMYGALPPNSVSAEVVTAAGEPIPVYLVPGAFIAVMPSAYAGKITFRSPRGRTVWSQHFGAEGYPRMPTTLADMARMYRKGLRVLTWRLRYGSAFWRR